MEEQPSAATSGPAAAAAAAGSAAAAAAAAPAATPDIYDLFRNSSAFPGDFDTLDMDAQNEMYSAYLSFIEQDGGGGGGGGSEGAMTGTSAASDHAVGHSSLSADGASNQALTSVDAQQGSDDRALRMGLFGLLAQVKARYCVSCSISLTALSHCSTTDN
jgi:hypothetical protein